MHSKDLLKQHPELQTEEKALEKLLKAMETPKLRSDKAFEKNLRSKIQKQIQAKKAENPKYLAFYLRNFRFYFSGFSVALGCFLVLFVLGFVSINSQPQLLSNPKILTFSSDEAFGTLNLSNTDEAKAASEALPVAKTRSLETAPFLFSQPWEEYENHNSLHKAEPRYHIGEKQLPKFETSYLVGKEKAESLPAFWKLSKQLHLPEFSLGKFEKGKLENLYFSDEEGKYEFLIDFNEKTLNIIGKKNLLHSPTLENPSAQQLSENTIKKKIKNQLSDFGLSLKYYGTPELESSDEDQAIVSLFYPRLLEKQEIRDEATNRKKGMRIYFDRNSEEISSLESFDFQSYELSNYPFTQTKESILEKVAALGNIDTSQKGEDGSISMQKGKKIWLKKGAYLVPGLLFEAKEASEDKAFFLPLY